MNRGESVDRLGQYGQLISECLWDQVYIRNVAMLQGCTHQHTTLLKPVSGVVFLRRICTIDRMFP